MQILGSQKLHFLDFLTARVLDMNCIPSIRCILARSGGWKWNKSYPPTHFFVCVWFSCKQAHSKSFSSNVPVSILEILRCLGFMFPHQLNSSVTIKKQSGGGSDANSSSISKVLVWLPDLWSDSRYGFGPPVVHSTMLSWESFLEAQSKTCSFIYV